MVDSSESSDLTLKQLGVRHLEGYFNVNSGRLEEIQIQLFDTDNSDKWWTLNYELDLGSARVKAMPEIQDPQKLAMVLTRADVAMGKIEGVDDVDRWHKMFDTHYGDLDIHELESALPKFTEKLPDDIED